ncbi:MAG: tRNA pseudouridine(55) synthase TruB [Bacillota bacterium]|nr:tRNA pseudouridine(55) synthase TruB [Bacillota bacterium]
MIKDGILILDKPQNWTSHDCVAVARKALGADKLGHGGTLDPMAEGLLPLFVGRATRIMEYLDMDDKTYICGIKLGVTTDTQDIWGTVIHNTPADNIDGETFEETLMSFLGKQKQIPPMYSAVRINGRRLYEYAREGENVSASARDIDVKSIKFMEFDESLGEGKFEMTVSKGTYIRTICNDIGEKLGCGAAMSYLKRTAVGIFNLDNATGPDRLKELMASRKELKDDYQIPADITEAIIPVDKPMVNLGKVSLSRDRAWYFVAGNSIRWKQVKVLESPKGSAQMKNKRGRGYDVLYRVYTDDERFIGTGYYNSESNELKADKIFVKRQEL